MVKKLLHILILVLFCQASYGQIPNFNEHLKPCSNIHFNAQYSLNSDYLNNDFIYSYLKGGYLERNSRLDQWENLSTVNKVGIQNEYSLFYTEYLDSLFGKDQMYFTFQYSIFNRNEIGFTDDLFHLIMFGNKSTAGTEMLIGSSSYMLLQEQSFKFGLAKRFDNSEFSHGLNLLFGFHIGQDYRNINADNGASLMTDSSGTYININAPVSYVETHTSTDKYRIAGYGLSLNLSYDLAYRKHQFFFAAENIGFHQWNNKTSSYYRDTSFTFYGAEIDDVTTVDSLSFPQLLDDYGITTSEGKYKTQMPIHLRGAYAYQALDKLRICIKYDMYLNSIYKGRIELKPEYEVFDGLEISPIFSLGGFAKYNYGLACKYYIDAWDIFIDAQTAYLNGIIFPGTQAGIGGQIKIAKYFGKCYALKNTTSSFL